MTSSKILTQSRLKELLHYCPESGLLNWRSDVSYKHKMHGKPASTVGNHGYIAVCIDGSMQLGHRLAFLYMTGSFPENYTDHIDGDRLNNKWSNLRDVSATDNGRNVCLGKNNKSGSIGVSWSKKSSKWYSTIMVDYKQIALGLFDDKAEAIAARQAANIKYGFHANHGRSA